MSAFGSFKCSVSAELSIEDVHRILGMWNYISNNAIA